MTEDTHWNPSNMIYGDNPVKWNECENDKKDPLGLNTYTLKPDMSAIMQSGNLYAYCMNNPIIFIDPSGNSLTLTAGVAIIGVTFFVILISELLRDPNFIRAFDNAINQVANDIERLANKVGQSFDAIKNKIIDFAGGKSNPKNLEKGMTTNQKALFSQEIHEYKKENGMPPNHNLPWEVLVALAEYARQNAK